MGKKQLQIFGSCLLLCSTMGIHAQTKSNNIKESVAKETIKNDSTKTKTELNSIKLGEVVVKADNIRFENGKVVMTPTKQAKNLANSISSLIDNMNTGILTVENDEIKTSNGQTVSLFINGESVNKFDKATFWAKNVLTVEYIPQPDDPKFLGNSHVLNLVMKEYTAGGLTRLKGDQTFPNDGAYSAASKLVVGKMTYHAMFKGDYKRDHISADNLIENYENVWYNNVEYDNIKRFEESSNVSRNNTIYAGLNARYKGKKTTATHSFNFNWQQDPTTTNTGLVYYTPDIISGNKMERTASSKNYSYGIDGNYLFKFSDSFGIRSYWKLNYSKNNSLSSYSENNLQPILNRINEEVWGANISFQIGKNFSKKIYTSFAVSEEFASYSTFYSGNNNSHQKQTTNNTSFKAYLYYTPIEPLIFTLTPRLSIYSHDVNDEYKKTNYMPGISFQTYYTINPKSSVSLGLEYYLANPSTSQTNDLILRQTELKWIEGTPSLKPSDFYNFYAAYRIMPAKWYILTLNAGYTIYRDFPYLSYRSGTKNYDGVIGKYINGIDENTYNINCNMIFKPFNGKLNITTYLIYSGYHYKHIYSRGYFKPAFMARMFLGNWSIGAGASIADRIIADGGSKIIKRPWSYYMNANYGNGNINLSLNLQNIFTKHGHGTTIYANGPYSYNSESIQQVWSRQISVSLTYTFDYGKKVDRSIDINSSSNVTTSILGSK